MTDLELIRLLAVVAVLAVIWWLFGGADVYPPNGEEPK